MKNIDIQFLVENLTTDLVVMLMETYDRDMKQALDELYTSETYKKLCDPACGLYYQSAVYVFLQVLNIGYNVDLSSGLPKRFVSPILIRNAECSKVYLRIFGKQRQQLYKEVISW